MLSLATGFSGGQTNQYVDHHITEARSLLLAWYEQEGRELPWRGSSDPYAILVSEVMLQQTQVDRVIPKYHDFLERFPTLQDLAEASTAEVIRAWSPLGYNRRAVNLQRIAREVVAKHGGKLPSDMRALRSLPGIGAYTAAAVACFAFGEPCAVVDTNVRRVLGRLTGHTNINERETWQIAEEYLPADRASEWSQALMDLGATLCKASAPACLLCPLRGPCRSRGAAIREERVGWVTSPKQEPFKGSSRQLRGRIVELLRGEGDGGRIAVRALAAALGLDGDAGHERLVLLLRGLERDGLIAIEPGPEPAVRLPR